MYKLFFFCYYFLEEGVSYFVSTLKKFFSNLSVRFIFMKVKGFVLYLSIPLRSELVRKCLWLLLFIFVLDYLLFVFGVAFVYWDSLLILEESVSLSLLSQEFLLFLETGSVSRSFSNFLDCWFYSIYIASYSNYSYLGGFYSCFLIPYFYKTLEVVGILVISLFKVPYLTYSSNLGQLLGVLLLPAYLLSCITLSLFDFVFNIVGLYYLFPLVQAWVPFYEPFVWEILFSALMWFIGLVSSFVLDFCVAIVFVGVLTFVFVLLSSFPFKVIALFESFLGIYFFLLKMVDTFINRTGGMRRGMRAFPKINYVISVMGVYVVAFFSKLLVLPIFCLLVGVYFFNSFANILVFFGNLGLFVPISLFLNSEAGVKGRFGLFSSVKNRFVASYHTSEKFETEWFSPSNKLAFNGTLPLEYGDNSAQIKLAMEGLQQKVDKANLMVGHVDETGDITVSKSHMVVDYVGSPRSEYYDYLFQDWGYLFGCLKGIGNLGYREYSSSWFNFYFKDFELLGSRSVQESHQLLTAVSDYEQKLDPFGRHWFPFDRELYGVVDYLTLFSLKGSSVYSSFLDNCSFYNTFIGDWGEVNTYSYLREYNLRGSVTPVEDFSYYSVLSSKTLELTNLGSISDVLDFVGLHRLTYLKELNFFSFEAWRFLHTVTFKLKPKSFSGRETIYDLAKANDGYASAKLGEKDFSYQPDWGKSCEILMYDSPESVVLDCISNFILPLFIFIFLFLSFYLFVFKIQGDGYFWAFGVVLVLFISSLVYGHLSSVPLTPYIFGVNLIENLYYGNSRDYLDIVGLADKGFAKFKVVREDPLKLFFAMFNIEYYENYFNEDFIVSAKSDSLGWVQAFMDGKKVLN